MKKIFPLLVFALLLSSCSAESSNEETKYSTYIDYQEIEFSDCAITLNQYSCLNVGKNYSLSIFIGIKNNSLKDFEYIIDGQEVIKENTNVSYSASRIYFSTSKKELIAPELSTSLNFEATIPSDIKKR